MKKGKWKKLLLLLLIFVLILAAYLILKNKNQRTEEENSGTQIIQEKSENIAGISFQIQGETEKFSRTENGWSKEGNPDFPVNTDALEKLLENILSLKADRVLENVDQLSQYGLEQPSYTVCLAEEDGTETEILLGKQNSATGDYYVSLAEQKNTVYVTGTDLSSELPDNVMDLAESEPYPSFSGSDITEISVQKQEGSFHLIKNQETSGWQVSGDDGTLYSAEYQNVSSLASTLSSLAYAGMADYDAKDLSIYGLDQPSATISLTYEEKTQTSEDDSDSSSSDSESEPEKVSKNLTVYIGNTDADGNYYIRLDGSGQVNTVSADSLAAVMENSSVDYWSSSIGYFSESKLKSAEITYQDITRSIERHTEKTEETENQEDGDTEKTASYTSGNTTLDTGKIEKFLYSLSGMAAQSKDPSLTTDNPPEIEVTVNTDTETFTITCKPYDENFYLVTDSEGRPGLVNKNDVKNMIENYLAIWN